MKLRKTPTQINKSYVECRKLVNLCSRLHQLFKFQWTEASAFTSQHVNAQGKVTVFFTFQKIFSHHFLLFFLLTDYSILR